MTPPMAIEEPMTDCVDIFCPKTTTCVAARLGVRAAQKA